MITYNNNYMGIVVQNNDPEKRGRLKIFVPSISMTLYSNWNGAKNDLKFKFVGDINPDIMKVLDTLKDSLPWAECASPLFGGSASGKYYQSTKKATTSDANILKDDADEPENGHRAVENYKPIHAYNDAFSSTMANKNHFTNQFSYEYTPSDYSNLARGSFTIPNVGSHVWVFFADGNPGYPVYFAAAHGEEDWKRIFTNSQSELQDGNVDYPGKYENDYYDRGEDKAFRSKHVLNSNKHTIEFVDTDKKETLKFTHYSGSFKEFNNYANIELASCNDQKMVIGDQFLTIQKNQSLYVALTQDNIIAGDQYITVGKALKEDVDKIVKILKDIHEYKMLFDMQRTKPDGSLKSPNVMSKYQSQSGSFAACPVCGNIPYKPKFGVIQAPNPFTTQLLFDDLVNGIDTGVEGVEPVSKVPQAFMDIIGGTGFVAGAICDTCGGSGKSPSTQDGIWTPEPKKQAGGTLDQKIKSYATQLAELERKLGEGDQITTISKNKVETVGLAMNDMSSYRVDPKGKLRLDGVVVAPEDVYSTFKTSPHVEYVDVDDVPGGDYILTCSNKYKLTVGAKGIHIKTYGPIDMYGSIINVVGEQVNISSPNEVFIDGGERYSLRARKVSFHPYEHAPVAIDGQLHVTRNTIIGGGLMVDGELGVNHITGPYDFKLTEPYYGEEGPIFTMPPAPGDTFPTHTHIVKPHTHFYKHLSVTFLMSQEAVRDEMINLGINSNEKLAAAMPIIGEGTPAGEFGGLSYDQFETLVGGPSDDAARNEPNVKNREVGRVNPDVKHGIASMIKNGDKVTYIIKYNFTSIMTNLFVAAGIQVVTRVKIPKEGSEEEPSVVSGPTATTIKLK